MVLTQSVFDNQPTLTTPGESTLHWKELLFGYDQFNRERTMDSLVEQLSNTISELCARIFPTPSIPKSVANRIFESRTICRKGGDR